MKKDGKKTEKELKETNVTGVDIALGALCPPAELGVLIYKYARNSKVKKQREEREQELEDMIKNKKTEKEEVAETEEV